MAAEFGVAVTVYRTASRKKTLLPDVKIVDLTEWFHVSRLCAWFVTPDG
jgi:hypothetical protein